MQQPVVRVGEWLVTPSINQISRNGRQLTLEPRLIDLLVFFAQHSGEVLSRDELIDNVWKRSIVTNHVVTGNDSNLLIVFYVQIMPDDFVMQLHRF